MQRIERMSAIRATISAIAAAFAAISFVAPAMALPSGEDTFSLNSAGKSRGPLKAHIQAASTALSLPTPTNLNVWFKSMDKAIEKYGPTESDKAIISMPLNREVE